MSLITDAIYTRLSGFAGLIALTSTRVYYAKAPPSPTAPFVVFNRISGSRVHSLAGPSGTGQPRFQFDCYAEASLSAAKAVADQVRYALDGYHATVGSETIKGVTSVDERDSVDATATPILHRVSIDLIISHAEATS
jgi:hypothetical protein